jgi:hypothetical protein
VVRAVDDVIDGVNYVIDGGDHVLDAGEHVIARAAVTRGTLGSRRPRG